jgi:orotate phosphoribosyltransferase
LEGKNVVLVEDVVSSGGALLDALDILEQDGIKPISAICIIDRESGGKESLEKRNISLKSLYTKSELETNI